MDHAIRAFLKDLGTPSDTAFSVEKLRGDASSRIYWRLRPRTGSIPSIIVMQLPANAKASDEATSGAAPTELPFLNVARYLTTAGVAVPNIYATNEREGLVFLEDLGDDLVETLVRNADVDSRRAIYRIAIDVVADLQRYADGHRDGSCIAFSRRFDPALLRWELDHFIEWGVTGRTGKTPSAAAQSTIDRGFNKIAEILAAAPETFVHRDFQSRNLIITHGRLRVIDFQDALMGPFVYDLVALLRDSYVTHSDDFVGEMLGHYVRRRDLFSLDETTRLFHIQTVQRKLKDAGRFVYIDRIKKNPSFLPYFEPSVAYVRAAFSELPEFRELQSALAETTPELAG
ncbi:MAG: phosphotransferase [Deltaproteobacteria bacterium]|nr:phosphotransferase [Deltaproteobacteria bacterium]